jgi:hypothetical protein
MTEGEEPGWVSPGAVPPPDPPVRPPEGAGSAPYPAVPPPYPAVPPPYATFPPPDPAFPPPYQLGPVRTEGLAVAALVLALVSLVLPFIAAIAAFVVAAVAARKLRRAPAGTLRGRGLVTAANIVAAVGLLFWVGIVVLGTIVVLQSGKPAAQNSVTDAAVPSGQEVGVDSLRVGDCVNDATIHKDDNTEVETVTIVPCWQPHDLEVYANRTMLGETFPSDEKISRFVDRSCSEDFQRYVGIAPDDSQFDYFAYVPSKASWEQGDHVVTCGVIDAGDGKLNGSARNARA